MTRRDDDAARPSCVARLVCLVLLAPLGLASPGQTPRPDPAARLAADPATRPATGPAPQAQPTGTATPSATAELTAAAIDALLQQLDRDFAAGDVAAYLGRFEPDHAGAVAMHGEHLRRQCARAAARERRSRIVGEPRVIGPRVVVRVHHELRFGPAADALPPTPLVEDSYLAMRADDDGRAVPTFAIEAPPGRPWVRGGKFRCSACNYEIGGVDGWLCVPLRGDRASALESVSFYLLGTDLACDVSVQIAAEPVPAKQVAQQLASAFEQLVPGARSGLPEPWLPPSVAAAPPAPLEGARIAVERPRERTDADGNATVFHVVAFGGLQHVLLARGSHAAMRAHAPALAALFASYVLLEADCDVAAAAARPFRHHTGGVLEANRYHNEHYAVDLQGPPGWSAAQRAAGDAFRVVWTSPDGSRLWLIGCAVPPGLTQWTRATADRWLEHLCAAHGVTADTAGGGADWTALADGGEARALVLAAGPAAEPAAPRRRWLRLLRHDDLLIVADGFANTAGDEATLQAALATLRRAR